MKIGRNIKYYRELHNLTQSEVAELAGINEKYLGRLERDESVPTIDKVEQLCTAFDIRVGDLLTIHPQKILTVKESKKEDFSLKPYPVYYCNCCGCTFRTDCEEDIECPECGCKYDEDKNYIEKTLDYENENIGSERKKINKCP